MQLSMTKLILMAVIITFTAALGAPIWAQKEKPLTKSQAMALLTSAEKPEDHERLAEYFNIKAAKLEAEAKEHKDLSNAYHKGKAPNMQNANWCDEAAANETRAAQENRSLAESHHKMAEDLRNPRPH
jgi:hypothetical protein